MLVLVMLECLVGEDVLVRRPVVGSAFVLPPRAVTEEVVVIVTVSVPLIAVVVALGRLSATVRTDPIIVVLRLEEEAVVRGGIGLPIVDETEVALRDAVAHPCREGIHQDEEVVRLHRKRERVAGLPDETERRSHGGDPREHIIVEMKEMEWGNQVSTLK